MIASADEFVPLRRSEHQEDYLRAANDTASPNVWLEIIRRFSDMRIWVAHNKTVPIEILSVLAHDPNPDIRVAVAMKNKLSDELFRLLANDTNNLVRERIAYNKKTPPGILRALANDSCESISAQSRERLKNG